MPSENKLKTRIEWNKNQGIKRREKMMMMMKTKKRRRKQFEKRAKTTMFLQSIFRCFNGNVQFVFREEIIRMPLFMIVCLMHTQNNGLNSRYIHFLEIRCDHFEYNNTVSIYYIDLDIYLFIQVMWIVDGLNIYSRGRNC